jgi:hypothetical protein
MKNNKLKMLVAVMAVLPLLALGNSALADEVTGILTTGLNSTVGNTVTGTVIVPPAASPASGTYTSTQSVTLAASGASSINYTIDGSAPTCSAGTVYSGAISVSSSEVITAISCYPDNYASSVATFSYAIVPVSSGGGGASDYTITVSAGSGGSISPTSTEVTAGNSQMFAITPDTGYQIASVSVDGNSVGAVATYTFSDVTSSHTISATFSVVSTGGGGGGGTSYYPIDVSAGDGGLISPTSTEVVDGGSQMFAITPAAGYQIASVLVDGNSVGAVASYTFSDVTSSHTISATFSAVTTGGGSSGTVAPLTTAPTTSTLAEGNIKGYGVVGKADFAIMMAEWGQTGPNLSADLNHDGTVNKADFAILMANWGK